MGRVHSVPTIPLIDRVAVDGFPCASAPRVILALAGSVSDRELEGAVDSAVRLGWTSEAFLRDRVRTLRHPGLRGITRLDRVLDGGVTHSYLERRFLELVRRAGLPTPVCQRIHRHGGRFVARSDFCFEPTAMVVCEVAGHATHAGRRQRQRDAQRHSELQLLGYRVLTFTYEDVADRPEWVGRLLGEVLPMAA